jgi:RNA polymerase sigma factor (sigma-70 family)
VVNSVMPDMESTVDLLDRYRAGDTEALDRLVARLTPSLRRWAHGRLPPYARGMEDTQDLVQESVIRAVRAAGTFQPRHHGALQAYLRQAVMNRIRDMVRRTQRPVAAADLPEDVRSDVDASPLDQIIGREALERYESALSRLSSKDRNAIVARLELQMSYKEVATYLGLREPSSARMAVARALVRLTDEMSSK